MKLKPAVSFKISSMDSLGQGVSKQDGQIIFIHKTLPGEEGSAEITAQKKGVAFGRLDSLVLPSADRIEPVCPHFTNCPSCHYLHTPYERELEFKKQSLQKIFQKLPLPEIKVIPAMKRLGYRNRIQLHYDTKIKKLGMLNIQLKQIVEVPQCLIGLPPIADELKRLYQGGQWLKEAPKNLPQGHVEIYWLKDSLQVNWNKPYAEGGFSQVFEEMNQMLKKELQNWEANKYPSDLLDLFAGNGNISSALNYSRRLCVDIYPKISSDEFFSQHLYADDALKNIKSRLKSLKLTPKTLVLDPPRSGLKELNSWLEHLQPQHVAYVSCDPHTMARDLAAAIGYEIKQILLLDFFPSTYHFETLIFLERKA